MSGADNNELGAAPALLDVAGLSVVYPGKRSFLTRSPDVRAVDDVTFSIAPGETLGLVGESGSGKSTVGRAILRFLQPADGDICFDGTSIATFGSTTPNSYRRAVQVVFQDPYASLNPRRSVGAAIGDPLTRHRGMNGTDRDAEVAVLLDRVGLAGRFAHRFPVELSGGQRQRVAIARALAMQPRLIVCDEAVSALDVSTQSQVINLLEDLQEQFGMSYLFIAHDLAVVKHISHRIAVMYRGKIVESGESARVYHEPAHPYTQMLIEAVPEPHPRRQKQRRQARRERSAAGGLEAARSVAAATGTGCVFAPRCAYAMEVCITDTPPVTPMPEGGAVACHLQTTGPKLDGKPLAAIVGNAVS